MGLTNTITEYGTFSKIFHWLSAALLIVQIPLGFYLVDMDFSEVRLTVESLHVTLGISIFYLTILRLTYKTLNPTPPLQNSIFTGQKLIAKLNHYFLKKIYSKEFYKIIQINLSLNLSVSLYFWFISCIPL